MRRCKDLRVSTSSFLRLVTVEDFMAETNQFYLIFTIVDEFVQGCFVLLF
jgi:hypothetical protein